MCWVNRNQSKERKTCRTERPMSRGKRILPCCVAIVLALALLLPAAGAHAGSAAGEPELATVVRCNPTTATGVVGVTNAVVDMYIEDVVGLYGADLQISYFNTTIAQVVDQLPATPVYKSNHLANSCNRTSSCAKLPTTRPARSIMPQPRSIRTLPVDGSGPVARITFQGVAAGTFIMTWGPIELSTINGQANSVHRSILHCHLHPSPGRHPGQLRGDAQLDHVLVAWETISETDNAGFNLYRAENVAARRRCWPMCHPRRPAARRASPTPTTTCPCSPARPIGTGWRTSA